MSLANWLVAGMIPGVSREPLKKFDPDPEALLRLLYRWRDGATKVGRKLGLLLRQAGFSDISMSARYECYSSLPFIGEYLALARAGG
jgi:hypothetical protein